MLSFLRPSGWSLFTLRTSLAQLYFSLRTKTLGCLNPVWGLAETVLKAKVPGKKMIPKLRLGRWVNELCAEAWERTHEEKAACQKAQGEDSVAGRMGGGRPRSLGENCHALGCHPSASPSGAVGKENSDAVTSHFHGKTLCKQRNTCKIMSTVVAWF